ncbi:helix-turn-helix domain-containing protein [Mucilaginibacter sp. KACC 22063]|uniref:helix-turn-helix domain-containing protein n=1 Tax=Mucilaginibacter sp. KACC 22063 TaxID=3025666 RepID=UPI00236659A7|nr:helix-turn-helix domain-containing protein [Mucilaginibacter sp. KACC 22063]WDF53362.1 helix-turn-helix domain-containing protein [Mucilaginibacter sp. KACC 22063]
MRYFTIQPPEELKPYVRFYWVLEHDSGIDEPSYVYRSVADGCAEMVFHYRATFNELTNTKAENAGTSSIQFQTTQYRRFITTESFSIFGAYIYPFAIPYLFNIPSSHTSNLTFDFDTFLGKAGVELEEQIMLAADNFKRAEILSSFFISRLRQNVLKDQRITTAIHDVIHQQCYRTVSQLADIYNLSTRQFDRKFKEYAGFSPKTYMRLVRFHDALNQYKGDKTLTQIALQCGYYDQSHFIHDVKEFTGYHPSFYFSGNAEGTEYRNL